MAVHLRRQDPVPCSGTRTNCVRPSKRLRCWPGSLMPSWPSPFPLTPLSLIFLLILPLLTHCSTQHNGTTAVALLRAGLGRRECAPPALL
ncbi:hypothetical protein BT67DRAFT_213767 [Trichocladium antarcticum]|uniref:Uncharacterized protein n=1 Tax=Trichocladium antarcticum TaxID=1450529 RepID=A0AAN6UDH8_9PEZI|nr:hypothetical protein BT67DRAFT_213767 [Trichocladium antarcticum]